MAIGNNTTQAWLPLQSFDVNRNCPGSSDRISLFSSTGFDCESLIPTCKVAMWASLIFKEFTISSVMS
ncbi:hypothetical protein NC652_018800 [Populus alba x Populus x berolinensis]|nr:hypothetical protein NC652_018800 [Populus alba x Populus x berolinensis]